MALVKGGGAVSADKIQTNDKSTAVVLNDTSEQIEFSTATVQRGIIDNSGNIIFGTASGAQGLEIQNSLATTNYGITVKNSGNGDVRIALETAATSYAWGIDNSDNDKLKLSTNPADVNLSALIEISSVGLMKLNTPTTGQSLEVNVSDNQANVIKVQQGSDNYLNIDTTNTSELMSFGNSNTDPDYELLGTGLVGIGVDVASALGSKLHVRGGVSGATIDNCCDQFVLEHSGNGGMTIATPAANTGSILFADPGSASAGGIQFDHFLNTFKFLIAGVSRVELSVADGLNALTNKVKSSYVPDANDVLTNKLYVDTEITAAVTANNELGELVNVTDTSTAVGHVMYSDGAESWVTAAIGSTSGVQAWDAGLDSISGLTTAADKMVYTTALDAYAVTDLTPFARTLLDDADASTMRSTLGSVIGTDVQAWDDVLEDLSALAVVAPDQMIYGSGAGTFAYSTLTSFARTLLDDADASTMRSTLGLVIGTDVQAFNQDLTSLGALSSTGIGVRIAAETWAVREIVESTSNALTITNGDGVAGNPSIAIEAGLDSIAALTPIADEMLYATTSDTYTTTPLTAFARTLLDDVSNTTARATLGVSIGSDVQAWDTDLDALAGVSTNGILVRTGAGSATSRSIVESTTNALTITNGDGVAGNPSLDVHASLESISDLTTVANQMIYTTGPDTYATTALSAYMRTLFDDTTASDARDTLELNAGQAGDIWVEKAGDTMTGLLTLSGNPTTALHAVPKQYVDGLASGLDPKESCKGATLLDVGGTYSPAGGTGGSGLFTGVDLTSASIFDSVTYGSGDRVCLQDQTDKKQNGIYVVTVAGASGSIERASDHDGTPSNEVSSGNTTFIEDGTVKGGRTYSLRGVGELALNVDPLDWGVIANATDWVWGNGLANTGNTINAVLEGTGTAGVLGTMSFNGDSIGVDLGLTSTVAAPGNITLDQLSNTTITGIADDHFIIRSGANWINATPAAARTALDLDAGGAGDIWVEKAGDTMTGDLTINGSQLLASNTAAYPGLSFSGDADTGLASGSADEILVLCGGAQSMKIQTTSVTSSLTHFFESGTASVPSIAFGDDIGQETGFFREAENTIGFTAAGSQVMRVGINKVQMFGTNTVFSVQDGTAALPSLSFNNDLDTGIYRPSADNIGFTINGALRAKFSTNGFLYIGGGLSEGGDVNQTEITQGVIALYRDDTAAVDHIEFHKNGFNKVQLGTTSTGALAVKVDSTEVFRVSPGFVEMINSSRLNLSNSANPASPDLYFNSDPNTGLYSPGADQVSVAVNGGERFRVANGAVQSFVANLGADGSAAAPAYSFNIDSNSGWYRVGPDTLGLSTGGVQRLEVDASALIMRNGTNIQLEEGTAAIPGLAFDVDDDTGMYHLGPGTIGFSSNAAKVLEIDSSGIVLPLNGSASSPSIRLNDSNTGLYVPGTDVIGFSAGGIDHFQVDTSGIVCTLGQLRAQDGSPAAPSITWDSDKDTGFYKSANNEIAVALGGVQKLVIDASRIRNYSLGTATDPSYAFGGDEDTGMYTGAVANNLSFSTGGVIAATFDENQTFRIFQDGTAGNPCLKINDADTGFFRPSENQLGISVGGAERARFNVGSFGVGTTNPLYVAHLVSNTTGAWGTANTFVEGNSPAGTTLYVRNESDTATEASIVLATRTTDQSGWQLANVWTSANTGELVFRSRLDATTSREVFKFSNNGAIDYGSGLNTIIRTNEFMDLVIDADNNSTTQAFRWWHDGQAPFSGTQLMTLSESGNLGIGPATSPATALHIQDSTDPTIRLERSAGTGYADIISDSGGNLFLKADAGDSVGSSTMRFVVDQLEGMRLTHNAELLLGTTTSAGYRIDVDGAPIRVNRGNSGGEIAVFRGLNNAIATINTSGIQLHDGTAANPAVSFLNDANTGMRRSGADEIDFVTGGTSRLRVSSTSVTAQLRMYFQNGTASAPSIGFINDAGQNTGIYRVSENTLGVSANGVAALEVDTAGINIPLAGTAAAPSIRLNDTNTGLYSLGTDLIAFSTGGVQRFVIDNDGQLLASSIGSAATPTWSFINDQNTGFYATGADSIGISTGGVEQCRINGNGVRSTVFLTGRFNAASIGATPTDENSSEMGQGYLNLSRDDTATVKQIVFGKNGSEVGSIQTTGSATTYNISSDARLKTNISAMTGGLDMVKAMKPVNFDWIKTGDADNGFLAQDMHEVYPEAVSPGTEENDHWSMDYGRITPALVSAIQEIEVKHEAEKARADALEARLAKIEAMLNV